MIRKSPDGLDRRKERLWVNVLMFLLLVALESYEDAPLAALGERNVHG